MDNLLKKILTPATAVLLMTVIFMGCSTKSKGSLIFTANGEDFVREGFVDKQGWHISFDKLYVNLSDITAYNEKARLSAALPGEHLVDLAAGDKNAAPITVGSLKKLKPGNYQSLQFSLKRASEGLYKGYSIIMQGTARKAGRVVPFTIKLDEEMLFDGKEGYVGEELKGVVKAGAAADCEMTFHFDHVFGDNSAAASDHINAISVGFDFFNQFAADDKVSISQEQLKSAGDYPVLIKALWTLGHLGEGHCDVRQTSTDL